MLIFLSAYTDRHTHIAKQNHSYSTGGVITIIYSLNAQFACDDNYCEFNPNNLRVQLSSYEGYNRNGSEGDDSA